MAKESLHKIVIAALLHDIGKFSQRAKYGKTEGAEEEFLKKGGYKHTLYTDYAVDGALGAVIPFPVSLQDSSTSIARLAAAHHNPYEDMEFYLKKADCLSAGLDRIETKPVGNNQTARQESIFSMLSLSKQESSEKAYHTLCKLSDYQSIFPTLSKQIDTKRDAEAEYEKHYQNFKNTLKKYEIDFKNMPIPHYIASLTSILEEYTWCVPSSTMKTAPDISLYDHAVTTAAIAQAIYSYCEEEKVYGAEGAEKAHFILFSGELSGIQPFIFAGESSGGVAKILRARSFYLQALTRSILLEILERLELLPIAKIMDAGGKFMLLLPNTEKTKSVLKSIKKEVQAFLVEKFQAEIRMQMAFIELNAFDMQQENFIHKIDEINLALEQDKLQPFAEYFKEHASPIIEMDWGGKQECIYCKREPATTQYKDSSLCPSCKTLIQIGQKLPSAKYVVFSKANLAYETSLPLFSGISISLSENKPAPSEVQEALDIINISDRGLFTAQAIAGHIPEGTFEDLAKNVTDPTTKMGVSMLGVYKADVDNLGLLFSVGFKQSTETKKDMTSVSRFATLSRMLNFFFSEYIIHNIKEKYSDSIYAVFAGGDDLFLLGTWTDIIDFAVEIRKDFAKFTANNPEITLSAGMSMVKAKLPMASIAKMAEHDLDTAKKKKEENAQGAELAQGKTLKNACHIFNITLSWEDFFKQIEKAKEFEKNIKEEKISYGLVRRLLTYSDECKAFSAGDIKKGIFLSHLAYDLARNVKGKDEESTKIKEDVALLSNNSQQFNKARVAISYALYKTRKV